MQIALNENGERINPFPKLKGICPTCSDKVTSKCGKIVVWHWAHLASSNSCDKWSEPDSLWHRMWQSYAPISRREKVIGPHRADIVTTDGTVIELQHSHLSPTEIRKREEFYGKKMIWIFDTVDAYISGRLDIRHKDKDVYFFDWKNAKKSIASCERRVLLDLGNNLLWIRKFYSGDGCRGSGTLTKKSDIIDLIQGEYMTLYCALCKTFTKHCGYCKYCIDCRFHAPNVCAAQTAHGTEKSRSEG